MAVRDKEVSKARVVRVARMYRTNSYAAEALGVSLGQFHKLCRHYGIQTPYERRQKAREGLQRKTYCLYCDELLVWPVSVCGACKGKGIWYDD